MNELVSYLRLRLTASIRNDRGASAVEYGLLVALIAIAIIVAVTLLGGNLANIFDKTANSLSK